VGLIAIGHSALTGEGTAAVGSAAYDNSWATGTSPEVDSIYLRLVGQEPDAQGWVFNAARGGADVHALAVQARGAFGHVPNPQIVIIQTIDNDIRCDGTDAQNIPVFGATLEAVLTQITDAASDTHVLALGQRGRPSIDFIKKLVAAKPFAKADYTGDGPCAAFDLAGHLVPANFTTLTSIIESYEGEQARVCAEFAQCSTDQGALATQFVEQLNYYDTDLDHLDLAGQARMAEIVWPIVQQLLGAS